MKHGQRVMAVLAGLLLGLWAPVWAQQAASSAEVKAVDLQPDRITLVRDSFGVPHIFAPTDSAAAWGLAWAHAEDNFHDLQYVLIRARGRMGELEGVSGAASDYFVQYIRADEQVEAAWPLLPPHYLGMLRGYAGGINAWAQAHPGEHRLKGLFPVTERDLLRGYAIVMSGMVGVPYALEHILAGKADAYMFTPGGSQKGVKLRRLESPGSNAFAFRAERVQGGHPTLVINPHLPYSGPETFYEVQVQSAEGWKVHGGTFCGTPFLGVGTTEHHSWSMTFNWPKFVDIYRLVLNPKNRNQYRLDGQWHNFERRKARLRVKLGPLKLGVRRELLWSVHGPCIRTKNGEVFATRFPHKHFPLAGYQWYLLNTARSLEEFRAAMQLQHIPLFNVLYADRNNNIYYISNSLLPADRNPAFNWSRALPGDTSAAIWRTFDDSPPQVLNPDCGVLYNTNNDPHFCTCLAENPIFEDNNQFWHWNRQNNRDHRCRQLLLREGEFDLDDIRAIKWDVQYPQPGPAARILEPLRQLQPEAYPHLTQALRTVQRWNLRGDTANREAALSLTAMLWAAAEEGYAFVELESGKPLPVERLLKGLEFAQAHLLKHHGRIDPPLGQVQVMQRGTLRLPVAGLPEVLAPTYPEITTDGHLLSTGGDTYTAFVQYNRRGIERLETVVPYGSSNRPESPHYTDQMPLFTRQQTKPMTLDREAILRKAKSVEVLGQPVR